MAKPSKLNELVAANKGASNRIINFEDLSEEELDELQVQYVHLAEETKKQMNKKSSCSLDDTAEHTEKKEKKQQ